MARANITFRATEEVARLLRESAKASGRSLNEEMMRRLEKSYDQEAIVNELAERLRRA